MEENDQLTFEGFNPTNKNLGTKGTYRLITDSLTKDKLIDLYYKQNKSLQDIAKEYNCTRQMVKLLMEKYGLKRRKRSNARVLAIKRGKFARFEYHDIDEDFFAQWTPEMAWVLGLLFTDGNIQTDRATHQRVSIASIDLDLLENVSRFLKTTRPIKKCIQSYDKTRHIYQLEFYREKMRDDLHNLGLIEKKSLIIQFPDVPAEYIRHFIRGCWDGDGTIYIDKEGKLNASYVTGSHEFIKRLVLELAKVGITKKRQGYPLHIHKEKRSRALTIKLNSRTNLETLFHFFYDSVDDTMFLRRKYDVFVKGLNISEETQKAVRELPYRYTVIPIRHEPTQAPPASTIDDARRTVNKRRNKKVLRIKNDDGHLKCKRCGAVSEILYMINEAYCPTCFAECYKT